MRNMKQLTKVRQCPGTMPGRLQSQEECCAGHSVVLGSATPSVESYDRAQQGQYRLFEMKERVSARPLPTVYTVDLREELRNGNRSILSDRLRELMTDRLEKKEQIMLFLNRRGVAGFVSCRSCGAGDQMSAL